MHHCRLIKKLDTYGIKGELLLWIKIFSDRSQQVVLNSSTSQAFTMSSGVHQGSVMGPVVFLLYVNVNKLNVALACLLMILRSTLQSG